MSMTLDLLHTQAQRELDTNGATAEAQRLLDEIERLTWESYLSRRASQ